MGGLKSTPIVCCASRILFPNCFSLRLIDISYMNGSRFLVIPFRMLGMGFHRNDMCQWGRGEKKKKSLAFLLFSLTDLIRLSFRSFLRSKILEMEKSNRTFQEYPLGIIRFLLCMD